MSERAEKIGRWVLIIGFLALAVAIGFRFRVPFPEPFEATGLNGRGGAGAVEVVEREPVGEVEAVLACDELLCNCNALLDECMEQREELLECTPCP